MSAASNGGKRRFKVGDQVRVISPHWSARYRRGKVIDIWKDGNDGLPYRIAFRNGEVWNLADAHLELA